MFTNFIILALLIIGLEPIENQILSLTCLPFSPNERNLQKMSQFDLLIIFPLIWALTLFLGLYYFLTIKILLPDFLGLKKIKTKKISYYKTFNKVKINNLFF